MTDDEAFIRAIVDAPGDEAPRLVYADWLDERDDPRGAYVRAEREVFRLALGSHRSKEGHGLLQQLAAALDSVWVARVSRPPVGVCCDHLQFIHSGPPLRAVDLDALEIRLGLPLPPEYAGFLLNYNGGYPRSQRFRADTDLLSAETTGVVRAFCRVGSEETDIPGVGRVTDWVTKADGRDICGEARDLIVFAVAPAEDLFLIGTGGARAGKVFWFADYVRHLGDPDASVLYPTLGMMLAEVRADRFLLPSSRL